MALSLSYQHTLAGPAICAGIGLHSGERVRVSIRPAAVGTGVVFVRTDSVGDNRVPGTAAAVLIPHSVLGATMGRHCCRSGGGQQVQHNLALGR